MVGGEVLIGLFAGAGSYGGGGVFGLLEFLEEGVGQESDAGAIEAICDQVIAANPKAVAEYKAGKTASINFLKGQVMKLSQGKANPNVVGEILAG